MNSSKLISVIITTYSRPKYLERALKSVLNQTYNFVEIIVVDDNGDNSIHRKDTEEIVDRYENVIYIKNKDNLGANKSRNIGVKNCKGNYIAFLDDDDEFLPQKLAVLFETKKRYVKNNSGFLMFSSYNVIGNEILQNSRWSLNESEAVLLPVRDKIFEGNYIGSNSFVFLDKKSFNQIGGYDEDLESSQDWDLYIRLALESISFICVNQELVNYYSDIEGVRITSNSCKRLKGFNKIYKKHISTVNKLSGKTKFEFFNYLYRRTVLISFTKGLFFFSKLIVNVNSLKNILTTIVNVFYPILFFFRSIFRVVLRTRTS